MNEIWDSLYFTCENLTTNLPKLKWNSLYLYKNVCTCYFPTWSLEFYVFHIWKTGCWLFHMKSEILYISLMNIRPLILVHKIWHFADFMYVIWGSVFPLLSTDFLIFHIRKSWQRLNPWDDELFTFHLGKFGSWFSYMKYGFLYFDIWNSRNRAFPHEIWNSCILHWIGNKQGNVKYGLFHISHFKICVLTFLHEVQNTVYLTERLGINFPIRNIKIFNLYRKWFSCLRYAVQ